MKNKNEWDLSVLTKVNFSQKRKKIALEHDKFIKKWQKRSDWLEDPAVLRKALDEFENLIRFYNNGAEEGYYYWLKSEIDENNSEVKAKNNQITDFALDLSNKLQFFELRLARLPQNLRSKFIKSSDLKPYKHFLERLFAQSDYLLSDQEEKLLRLKEQTSNSNWTKMTSGFLSAESAKVLLENGKYSVKSFSEISGLISSKNKKVRNGAAKAFNQILEKNIKVGENELNSILANKKVDDELRGLKRPDLARHLSDDIDSSVVDSMVQVVSDNFSLSQKYYKLKAQLLKVKKLKYHERSVLIGKVEIKYSYNDSKKLLQGVLAELDSEFVAIFNDFDQSGFIDVYPKSGKRSGAFCVSESLSNPTFIMLNHNDKLNDVLTLAHEVGHGINNELMRQKQNALNFGTPLSTAEVASTFFEDFILKALSQEVDDETRLGLIMEKLNQDVSTIFRQTALYLFEKELHQQFRAKGYLSSVEIGQLFQKHMSAYMGDSVEQSKGSENWWLYWSHIRAFFYVYSYVSGLLISKSLQGQVSKDKGFIEDVKYFLSAGLSESPRDIFNNLGIDIHNKLFWKKGIDEVEVLLKEAQKLSKKLNKI
ncbi:MAG: M3 family oligoendopeptidase [Candidatus Falkowbacteria bacterium]